MTAAAPVLLCAEDLAVRTDRRTILEPVGLTLTRGRVLGLVGESGSGKTTLGRALLGELAPGLTLTGRVERGARIGYLPQHPGAALTPSRRVGAVLTEVVRHHLRRSGRRGRVSQAEVRSLTRRATTRAGVDPALLDRYPHQLSGGQQQRYVLAQVLATEPEVLIADEPTTGQDPVHRRLILDELARLVADGVALVLLSHDLDSVRALADETVVLRRGQVVERGPHVWSAPRTPYARRLLQDRSRPPTGSDRAPTDQDRSGPVVVVARPSGPEPGGTAPGTDHPPTLVVSDLHAHHRRRRPVLSGIDLELRSGRCLAVLGSSGSGKSTLARTLVGLHRRASATMTLHGSALPIGLGRRSAAQRADIAYAFQDGRASLDPFRTVLGQITDSAVRLRGWDRPTAAARATETLQRLQPDLGPDVGPTELSGGQAQRAALARELVARPTVLLCDEVTSGLDVLTRDGVLAQLASIRDELGTALLVVTHERAVVDALADRVLRLDPDAPGHPDPPDPPDPDGGP